MADYEEADNEGEMPQTAKRVIHDGQHYTGGGKHHTVQIAEETADEATAAAKVFGIAELLEQILIEADFVDVLLLQRVNKTFAATTSNSTSLQYKLHLKPEYDCLTRTLPLLPK